MYAIGLLASFVINVGSLLIYRYFRGTKDIREYYTSRAATLALEFILVACFVYLAAHKPYGTALWATVVVALLAAGIPFSRRYGPERQQVRQSDYPMEMLLALAEGDGALEIYFRRPGEHDTRHTEPGTAFITFFSPRQGLPPKLGPAHYRFPVQPSGVFRSITAILDLLEEEYGGREIHIHLGWPLSSWLDRLATGVFVANMMRLPRQYPHLRFTIEYLGQPYRPAA
jgi:hypothetical protein